MKLIDGKSLLLGVGLGVIVTALLGIVFFLGTTPSLSDDEIRERAKALCMSELTESELGEGLVQDADGSIHLRIELAEEWETLPERLAEAGIIESAMALRIRIRQQNPEFVLLPGEYLIPAGHASEDLAAILAAGPVQ